MNDYQIKHSLQPVTKAHMAKKSAEYRVKHPEKTREYYENWKANADWRDIVKNTKASYYGE